MKALNNRIIIAALAIMSLASCSTEEAIFTSDEVIVERIDMTIDPVNSSDKEYIFLQSLDGQEDLVDYNYFGDGANSIEFKINLGQDRILIIKMLNREQANPWMYEGESYNIYATQNHEDKTRYITAELMLGNQEPTFLTNNGNSFPGIAHLDVFRILSVDLAKKEIHCRLIDLPMVDVRDNDEETILISGTFRGSLSFIQ